MEDGKREAAVSMLPIIPEDSDTGRTYTCRVLNPAAPAGRQTSVTINVQRECPWISFPHKDDQNSIVMCKTHKTLFYCKKANSTSKISKYKPD